MKTTETIRRRREARTARRALAADLAGYTSTTELLELSAILARHSDAEAAEIRDLVHWTRAA